MFQKPETLGWYCNMFFLRMFAATSFEAFIICEAGPGEKKRSPSWIGRSVDRGCYLCEKKGD